MYSPRLAELGDSLRKLTKKNVTFIWGPEHTKIFDTIKKEITSIPTLKYFDPKQISYSANRCKLKDLGAVLL